MPFGGQAILGRRKLYSDQRGRFVDSAGSDAAIIKPTSGAMYHIAWSSNGLDPIFYASTYIDGRTTLWIDYGVSGLWNGSAVHWDNQTFWTQLSRANYVGNPHINSTVGGDYADHGGGDNSEPQEALLRIWNHGDGTARMVTGQIDAPLDHLTYLYNDDGGREVWYWDRGGTNVYVELDGSIAWAFGYGAGVGAPWVRINGTPTIEEPADCVYGCMDEGANNYNPSATCADGSCTYDIYGCTDPGALNYNDTANIDDGSCTYCTTYGCMDGSANNYNPSADCDDGSCTYDVGGCMDSSATNYNPSATYDDGSCSYAVTSVTLVNPGDGSEYTDGTGITLTWDVDHGDTYGTVYLNGVGQGDYSSGGYSYILTGPYGTQYTFYVVVGGVTSNAATVTLIE